MLDDVHFFEVQTSEPSLWSFTPRGFQWVLKSCDSSGPKKMDIQMNQKEL